MSIAGPDQSLQGLSSATLAANTPVVGTGVWSIVSGIGGSFDDPIKANAIFSGTNGSSYVVRWTIVNGDCESASELNVAFPLLPPHTWQGDVDSDWFNSANWTDGIVPNATSDITIKTGNPYNAVIDGTVLAEANDLTISSGTFTVKPGAHLTVHGNLVTNDGFIIENTNPKPASVITHGTVSGETTVRWVVESRRYWYSAHSVSGVTMDDYNNSYTTGDNDYFLYHYAGGWVDISKSTSYNFVEPLEGYHFIVKNANSVLEYGGILNNNSSYSRTIGTYDYTLVANPYASYIDLLVPGGVDFDGASPTVYTRTDVGTDLRGFATFHVLTNASLNNGAKEIAPGQSVWIGSGSSTSNFVINSTARVHHTDALKGGNIASDYVKLTLKTDFAKDEAAVAIHPLGLPIFTSNDAPKKLASGAAINLYSIKDENKVAVSIFSEITDQQRIPLGYTVSEEGMSEFQFRFEGVEKVCEGFDAYLIDKELDIQVDLREVSEYSFAPSLNISEDRFELYFQKQVSTKIDIETEEALAPKIFAANGICHINIPIELLEACTEDVYFELFEMSGNSIKTQSIITTKYEFQLPSVQKAYIVQLVLGDKTYNQKIMSF